MKKTVPQLLVLLLLIVLLPFAAPRAGAAEGGSYGPNVTWRYSDGVLYLEGTGETGGDSQGLGGPWWDYRAKISRVVVSEGITGIYQSSFYGCENLYQVELPSTLTRIGANAFTDCSSLSSISLPEGLKVLGDGAFSMCRSLSQVTVPASVTSIGEAAFTYCSNLRKLTILNKSCVIDQSSYTLGDAQKTVICGYRGSTAEAYAEKYRYSFTPLDEAASDSQKADSGGWPYVLLTVFLCGAALYGLVRTGIKLSRNRR